MALNFEVKKDFVLSDDDLDEFDYWMAGRSYNDNGFGVEANSGQLIHDGKLLATHHRVMRDNALRIFHRQKDMGMWGGEVKREFLQPNKRIDQEIPEPKKTGFDTNGWPDLDAKF